MKKVLLIVCALWLSYGSVSAQYNRCATMENYERLKQLDPGYEQRLNALEQLIQSRMANDKSWRTTGVVTIPVVFHVLYSTNNATQNISLARINAQMAVLNADYSATNTDVTSVPSVFQPFVGNTGIQFCLAVRDPQGNTTDGIIRKQTTTTQFFQDDGIKYDASGGDDAWPRDSYLNIWVGNLGSSLLGYAQFPGGLAATDGVVLLNGSVGGPGALGTASPYNRGRTATHEIGHWLNLRHINGDSNCGNDFVSDTPVCSGLSFGCPSFPTISCSNGPNGGMTMNYMDYTDDACMYMFTIGQGVRMNTSVTASRPLILNSMGCVPVVVGAPNADFSASATNIPVGTSIDFTDLSAGAPNAWTWTFTGGTPASSSVQNPTSITYNTPGTYTVSLTVNNVSGSDTETKVGYITVVPTGGSVCDTLANFLPTATPTILLSGGPGGVGYVSGHNNYLDKAKADKFTQVIPANSQVTGALIGFGVATAANNTNTFNVSIWDDNGAAGAPGTVLGTATVTYATAAADLAAGNLTAVTFSPPVNVTSPFYLGVAFTYTNLGDTIAVIETADGEVNPGTAWEQFSTNDWHAFSETPASWGINVALLVLPVVCPANSVNDPIQNGISIFPNPTSGQLTIYNGNTNLGTAEVKVVNVMGQTVLTQNYSDFSGSHHIDLSNLSNGLYFVNINSGNSNTVHRIMLNK